MSNDLHHAPPPPPPPPEPPPPPAQYAPYATYPGVTPKVRNGQSIASLVLGCCSILFYWTLIVPALAIVLGGIAIKAQRKAGQRVSGMAIAGLVLGIVFVPLGLLFWIMMP